MQAILLLVVSFVAIARSDSVPSLQTYNIDTSLISTSGISAGGYMAVQFHISFSKDVMGVGVVAGGPYWCAEADVELALSSCETDYNLIDVDVLVAATIQAANVLSIDPLNNVARAKVFIFSGTLDSVVVTGVVQKLQKYYEEFIATANIVTIYNVSAEHSMPTNFYGNACDYLGSPYINDCGYDAAWNILNQIYGNIRVGSIHDAKPQNLFEFDQQEFFGAVLPEVSAMDPIGYIYVPTACQNSSQTCRLHVAFHGCYQSVGFINTTYVLNAGYNNHAEINNIVVLYPQSYSTELNPRACFDWWGYTGLDYATKIGIQLSGIGGMVSRVTGGKFNTENQISSSSSSSSSFPSASRV